MVWLQEKYIKLLSLPKIDKKDSNYNFRCIICGDSKQVKSKKRGYFLLKEKCYYYYCHNCGVSLSFDDFLKTYYYSFYVDYKKESIENFKLTHNYFNKKIVKEIENSIDGRYKIFIDNQKYLNELHRVIDIKKRNDIINYIEKRKFPYSFIKNLFYTNDFRGYVNRNIINKFEKIFPDIRIVIPCYNLKNELIYVQGRTIDNNEKVKYITIKIKDEIKMYGLNNINNEKDVFVFEGIFDSIFIKNSIATLGANFNVKEICSVIKKPVFVLDNDFRTNKEVKSQYSKIINAGHKICIMPKYIKEKDINEMIINGYTLEQIENIIKENIYDGFEANIKLEYN